MRYLDDFIAENHRPTNIYGIGIFNSSGTKVGTIPCSKEADDGVYSFGLLSDVHQRASEKKGSNTDFQRALTYFKGRSNVEFTCICGDITYDANDADLTVYKNAITDKAGNKPVYTCAGNHDRWYKDSIPPTEYISDSRWGNTNLAANDPAKWKSYTGMEDSTTNNKHKAFTVSRSNTHGTCNDYFIFFSMDNIDGSGGSSSSGMKDPYIASDITWLTNQLEAHKNQRVFIFLHCFFPDCAGNYGNIYQTSQGAKINTNRDNWKALRALAGKYLNTVWFSGHSHWKWELQGIENSNSSSKGRNFDANIFPCDGATREMGWCVHVPSCSEPATPIYKNNAWTQDTSDDNATKSQIGIVDVYPNYILIRGMDIDSTKSTYHYLPLAQYKLDTTLR